MALARVEIYTWATRTCPHFKRSIALRRTAIIKAKMVQVKSLLLIMSILFTV